jgi:hypothetical protein
MKTPWGKRNTQKWLAHLDVLLDAVAEHESRDVRVQFTSGMTYGECDVDLTGFVVRIGSRQNYSDAIHTLIHELAHVVAWDSGYPDHSDVWGLAYASLYRVSEAYQLGKT